jgi:hypothetical protein
MPHSLNDQGISVGDVKNHSIFMKSPASQLAKTDSLNPLQLFALWFVSTCGSGSVASIANPRYPMSWEYPLYKEAKGLSTNSHPIRPMKR